MKQIIVDDEDNIIGYKDRDKMELSDIYRVSALWITNSKGEILLARRAYDKEHDPGKWGPAAAGTVEEGETYESNIIKEAEEEIGLKNIKPQKGPKIKVAGKWTYFGQWFLLKLDQDLSDFKIQKEEVAQIAWFPKKELRKEIEDNPDEFISHGERMRQYTLIYSAKFCIIGY